MGATYAALLDRLQRRGWSHPDVPVRCRNGRSSGSRCASRHDPANHVHVVGAGLAGLAAALALAERGRRASRCTRPGRRRAGAAGPISTASSAAASTTATTCCCPATAPRSRSWTRSARAARMTGPGDAAVPVRRPRHRRALDRAAERRPAAAGGCSPAAGACPACALRDYLPAARPAPRRAPDATVADALRPGALYRAPARAAGDRRAEHAARDGQRPPARRGRAARAWPPGGAACIPRLPARRPVRNLHRPGDRLAARRTAPRSGSAAASPRSSLDGGRVTGSGRHRGRRRRGGRAGRPRPGRDRAAAGPAGAGPVRGDPQRAFPHRRRPGRGRVRRPDRRHGGVGVRQAGRGQRHHLRRQSRRGHTPCGFGATGVAGCACRTAA